MGRGGDELRIYNWLTQSWEGEGKKLWWTSLYFLSLMVHEGDRTEREVRECEKFQSHHPNWRCETHLDASQSREIRQRGIVELDDRFLRLISRDCVAEVVDG